MIPISPISPISSLFSLFSLSIPLLSLLLVSFITDSAYGARKTKFPNSALTFETSIGLPATLLEGSFKYMESSKAGGNVRWDIGKTQGFHLRVGYLNGFDGFDEVKQNSDQEIVKTGYKLTRSYIPVLAGARFYFDGSKIGRAFLLFEAGVAINLLHREKNRQTMMLLKEDETILAGAASFSWGFLLTDLIVVRVGVELSDLDNVRDNREYMFTLSTGFSTELW